MKAQFKYSFLAGLFVRLPVFIVIVVMTLGFGIFRSLGMLPQAARITAAALGGVAISVMLAVNIIGDINIARRMFHPPDAYLHALTPAPRRHTLFASLISMVAMDVVTMAPVIAGEVWMGMNIGENYYAARAIWGVARLSWGDILTILSCVVCAIIGYALFLLIIMFCVAAGKSFLYKMPASGFLAFLLGCASFYVCNLLQLLLTPFGYLERYGLFFTLHLAGGAMLPLILLTGLTAAGMFALTSYLLERKVNL